MAIVSGTVEPPAPGHVEAIGQAEAYGPQDWATIVAPTNRRPFGYDWEDWGEMMR